MREFVTIALVCVCMLLLAYGCRAEEAITSGSVDILDPEAAEKLEEQAEKKDGKIGTLPGSVRRTSVQNSGNSTRDSQLLSLLAARRRQLLSGRLATHINTIASLAHKANKSNTTFAQLEIYDSNNSTVKRITFENSSNEDSPSLKLVTTDGAKEIRQDVKPHEIRHIFLPKVFQEIKTRSGFTSNRKKEVLFNKTTTAPEQSTDIGVIYIPPEDFDGSEKEIDLDPEEVFQVDESNHGIYLLNYTDSDNVTQKIDSNKLTTDKTTTQPNFIIEVISPTNDSHNENITVEFQKIEKNNTSYTNNTEDTNKENIRNEVDKEKGNNTLFMTDEIYNHFRPLESELPVEDMAPFIYFGQKIGGPINDNLTYSPSISASTKSVNFIFVPPEKRKFNSRYATTEKYRNTSTDEEEINEDMDVSVVKNIIEKNKVRNTVKGPAPARNVGIVNAYRRVSTTAQPTLKPLNIAQLNITEPIVQNVSPIILDKSKNSNRTNNSTIFKENVSQVDNISNPTFKLNTTAGAKNYTRNYFNLRRRPSRLTTISSTENVLLSTAIYTTTEKVSTSVYTAVVTSVSITSSVKGQNRTDEIKESDNNTTIKNTDMHINSNIQKAILLNNTDTVTVSPSTQKPHKHKIRIRTTTTESSVKYNTNSTLLASMNKPSNFSIVRDLSIKNEDLNIEASTSKLGNVLRHGSYDATSNTSTVKPKNLLRRRRPTTTTSTTLTPMKSSISAIFSIPSNDRLSSTTLSNTPVTVSLMSTSIVDTTENPSNSFVVTSRTSSESSVKPQRIPIKSNAQPDSIVNVTKNKDKDDVTFQNEVVIEAEKTYTASYVLAGLGFLPILAIIAFVLRNIILKKTKELDMEYEGYFEESDMKKESITPVARPPLPTPTKPDNKWEFPRNKLRLQTLLGQGNFGQVWKAEADDLNGHDGLTRLVAVKSIKESASQKEKQELLHEIFIMQKIGTHPNVVTLLGCCTEQEPYLLIMEYVMCGKLLTYLRERRSRPDRFSGSGALTSRDLTVFAYCVARGMDYIASKGIVHRDLAARNVLVDHNKLCKIADFGMSRCMGGGRSASGGRGALPVRWMAPEALLYNLHTHRTDVWAYGVLLWEIVTLGSTPYATMSGREVLTAVTEGYRLERPPHCKPQLYRAMYSCWHADPSQRPTFAALKAQLAELLDNEPSEGNYVDLDSFYQESSVYSDPSAIIHDDEGLSSEYDRERRCFRELNTSPPKFDNRSFNFRDEEIRNNFSIGTSRMGGFGIRDVPFNDRNFSDGEFNDRNFPEKPFADANFSDTNFTERKDGKLSTSSFHRERERENPLVSRNSFNGFPRVGTNREGHFQLLSDNRNKRVSEFECDI